MKAHEFFNLLDGRIVLARLKNGIWTYPPEFEERYNASVASLERLASEVNKQLEVMTALEREQFRYTAGSLR